MPRFKKKEKFSAGQGGGVGYVSGSHQSEYHIRFPLSAIKA